MSVLICGSMTYDTIMVFNDKFKHQLIPEKIEEALDVYFMVPDLRRQFGGCAGNIAYNLKMLGAEPLVMATVGTDFDSYAEWLDSHHIRRDYLTKIDHCYTAQTFITIDMDDNQITAFHPGAMSFSHYNQVWKAIKEAKLGIISLDSTDAMMTHALQFIEAGIPFVFDPGESTTQFDGDELLKLIEQASWVLVNEKGWQTIEQRTRLTPEQAARRVQALIITKGKNGSTIYAQEARYQIPPAKAREISDTRSCGDAFCAGILYGLIKDIDWETTGRIASLMGAIKVEHHGSQNHIINVDLFKTRFKKTFGYALIV